MDALHLFGKRGAERWKTRQNRGMDGLAFGLVYRPYAYQRSSSKHGFVYSVYLSPVILRNEQRSPPPHTHTNLHQNNTRSNIYSC